MPLEWICEKCGSKNKDGKLCACGNAQDKSAENKELNTELKNENISNKEKEPSSTPNYAQKYAISFVNNEVKIGGLLGLAKDSVEGTITPEEFLQKIYVFFDDTNAALQKTSTQLQDILSQDPVVLYNINCALEDVARFLQMSASQFELYGTTKELQYMRIGINLAQTAEECLKQLSSDIYIESTGDSLPMQNDVFSGLGSLLAENQISLEEYSKAVDKVENRVKNLSLAAHEQMENAFKKAKEFDGQNPKDIMVFARLLKNAAQLYSNAVIALQQDSSFMRNAAMLTLESKYFEHQSKASSQDLAAKDNDPNEKAENTQDEKLAEQ